MFTLKIELLGLERFFHLDRFGSVSKSPTAAKPSRRRNRTDPVMPFTRATYIEIMQEMVSEPPERACLLLGHVNSPLVTHYVMDETGESSPLHFRFDDVALNAALRKYLGVQMEAKGFCHSHPRGCTRLSGGDLEYLRRIWANPKNDCERILMPIVVGNKMYPYVVDRASPASPKLATLQFT